MKEFIRLTQKIDVVIGLMVVLALFSLAQCELLKDEEIDDPVIYEPDLVHCELAFPGVTGDRYVINYGGESITYEFINGLFVYQGDIIIEPNHLKSAKGGGIESNYKRWEKNIVPYRINGYLPEPERVTQAIKHYEENTNISFVEHTDQENYIEFVWNEYGCSSYLGMIGGKQDIRIADWAQVGNVMHEIGHALGLIHEHSIQNRNDSINIVWENIPIEKQHNFRVLKKCLSTQGFDFNSVMLWSSDAIAIENEKPTMIKKDGRSFISQRDSLSMKDIEIINQMYPPFVYLHLKTNLVTDIFNSTATCGGTIVEHYNVNIISKGVCWSSLTPIPNINNMHTDDGGGTESYTSTLTELISYRTYYVRAYAFTGNLYYYGDIKSFVAE